MGDHDKEMKLYRRRVQLVLNIIRLAVDDYLIGKFRLHRVHTNLKELEANYRSAKEFLFQEPGLGTLLRELELDDLINPEAVRRKTLAQKTWIPEYRYTRDATDNESYI